MKKINLEKILIESKFEIGLLPQQIELIKSGDIPFNFEEIIKAMRITCKEVLVLAAENANLTTKKVLWDDPKEGDAAYMDVSIIDKQSIMGTIKDVI